MRQTQLNADVCEANTVERPRHWRRQCPHNLASEEAPGSSTNETVSAQTASDDAPNQNDAQRTSLEGLSTHAMWMRISWPAPSGSRKFHIQFMSHVSRCSATLLKPACVLPAWRSRGDTEKTESGIQAWKGTPLLGHVSKLNCLY